MLGLKLPTDPRWISIAESNLEEILIDHAWCEQKATSNAISIIVSYPEYTDLVDELLKIAKEELQHFGMVHEKIKARGYVLGPERKDIAKADLLSVAKQMNIKKAEEIMSLVSSVIKNWSAYADEVKVDKKLRDAIKKTLLT